MESQRTLLFVALAFVSFLLYQQWQIDYNTPVQPVQTQEQAANSDVPEASNASALPGDVPASSSNAPAPIAANQQLITVKTDVLTVKIDTKGGDVVYTSLDQFPVELDSEDPFIILQQQGHYVYSAQSGLIGPQGPDEVVKGRPTYQVSGNSFELTGDELIVPMTFVSEQGLSVTKSYVFRKGDYNIDVIYQVQNLSSSNATMLFYGQLKQSVAPLTETSSMFMANYRGPAYSAPDDETNYQKYDFSDISDQRLNLTTQAGWVAMLQHYFVAAWVPDQDAKNQLYSSSLNNDEISVIGFKGQPISIAPSQTSELKASLYIGPKDQDNLKLIAKHLDLTVDYGFLWVISQFLFWLLQHIQAVVGNWGVAIIAITILMKLVLYPLTKAQYVSMAKMRKLAPKMQALKERYGDDRQKMGQATMEMYKKEKVNPAGGCLPMLLQMPIFLALYWVFLESYELRQADFALWINDLSAQDPFYVLPVLMGISMFVMQKMQPMTITDPMQQKVMQFMPVMMTVFFLWFPSGLVLYWLVSNLITMAQMWWIFRGIRLKEEAASKSKK